MPKSDDTNRPDVDANEEERTPGFSRTMVGRIIGVALFICLGTFAVAQTVMSSRDPSAEKDSSAQTAQADQKTASKSGAPSTSNAQGASDKAALISNVVPASLQDATPASRPGGEQTSRRPPVRPASSPSTMSPTRNSGFQSMPQRNSSPSSQFGLRKPKQPSTLPGNSGGAFPTSTTKTPASTSGAQPDESTAPSTSRPSAQASNGARQTPGDGKSDSFMPQPNRSMATPNMLPPSRPGQANKATNRAESGPNSNRHAGTPSADITQNDLRGSKAPASVSFSPQRSDNANTKQKKTVGSGRRADQASSLLHSAEPGSIAASSSSSALPRLPSGNPAGDFRANQRATPSTSGPPPSRSSGPTGASGSSDFSSTPGSIPANLMPVNPQPAAAFDRTRTPTNSTASNSASREPSTPNRPNTLQPAKSPTRNSQPTEPSRFDPTARSARTTTPGARTPAVDRTANQVGATRGNLPTTRKQPENLPIANPVNPAANRGNPQAGINSTSQIPNMRSSVAMGRSSGPAIRNVSTSRVLATPGGAQLQGPQSPAVTIQKIGPREIQVNTPAEFQLVVRNSGPVAVHDVVVLDRVPSGARLVQAMPSVTPDPSGLLNWNLGTLEPGAEKRIELQLLPTQPGEIGSVAQVMFAAQASARTRVTRPILKIRHSGPSKVLIGETAALEITVANEGDGPATNVLIQEDVPSQLRFQDGFQELEYEVGTLGPGQSRTIQLALTAAQVGRFRNTVVALADGGLSDQHAIDMEVIAPQLTVKGTGPSRRYLNRDATHEFEITNRGTAAATNVELMAKLPPGLKFLNANNQGVYDPGTHAVYWSLAELGEGQSASVQLTTTPVEPGDQSIQFMADADLNQHAEFQHPLSVEHLVDVFFDIDDVVDPIEIGSETTYRLRIVNQGTRASNNIELTVAFPDGIQPVSVEGNVANQIAGQQVRFAPITSLNPGDEIRLTIRARGTRAGDHRVAVNLQADGREINVTKEESTRVYSDR